MDLILHITGTMDRAGAETMLMNLYREMDRSQIQFDFVSFGPKKGDYEDEITELGGKVYHIVETNPLKRMIALKNLLQEHPEYKIMHCHMLFSNAFHVVAGKMAKVPYRISHSHNTSAKVSNKIVATMYHYLSRRLISRYSTHFIGCGKEASEFLFPNQKEVLILPNSINTEEFATIGESHKDYINSTFYLDDKVLKIIQVGRLQKVKNHKFSIAIAKKLQDRGVAFRMFFIGQGELYEEIEKQIKEQDLPDGVLLLGLRTDIPELMAGADVMLMPSLHEGFPVVLVESQAVGLPAVISNRIAAEVDLGVDLVKFKALEDTEDAWIEEIKHLQLNQKLNKDQRLNILEQKGFNVKANAKRLTALYNAMIK